MAGDLDAFQERLNRINARHGGNGGARPPSRGPSPTSPRRPRPAGTGIGRLVLRLVTAGGFAVGAAMVLVALSQTTTTGPLAISKEIRAERGEAPSALQSVLNRVASFTTPGPQLTPVDHLPAAPEGWVRVTEADARQSDILATVQQGWPRAGNGVIAIDQHPAWPRLQDFVRSRANPDLEMRVLARSRGSALYLGPGGDYAIVRLSLMGERTAFGDPADPDAWLDAMTERARSEVADDEMIEQVTLSGIRLVNLTKRPGQSLIARPIGSDLRTPNGMQLLVPLTHRAMLEIRALAAPQDIGAMISTVDRTVLAAQGS